MKAAGIGNRLKPIAFIAGFGIVSMLMDIVYEGAISVQGPLLASLGASAALVGIVSGIGEGTALIGRLFSGPAADKTGRYWLFAILGYAITALSVPAMGFVGSIAAVSTLIIVERFGKSLRTPSRDAMLSHAAAAVGKGKGFALHEVLDQIGAIAGPLIVSAILSATHNEYAHALGVLAIPGIISICILMYLRHRMPHPRLYEDEVAAAAAMDATVNASSKGAAANATASAAAMATTSATADTTTRDAKTRKGAGQEPSSLKLPARFWLYTGFCGLVLAGVATFGVLSYHMVSTHVTDDAIVPIIYAGAMAIDAVFAAITGVLYDKLGTKVLFALPLISAAIPWFAYSSDLGIILIGVLLWGASLGIQESTMRAAVSDMVPSDRRATSYGMFSVAIGIGSLIGGAMAGILYTISVPLLIGYTSVVEIVALALLAFIAKTRKVA